VGSGLRSRGREKKNEAGLRAIGNAIGNWGRGEEITLSSCQRVATQPRGRKMDGSLKKKVLELGVTGFPVGEVEP